MNVKTETHFDAPVWERIGVCGILVYFIGRLLFFALNVPENIPPDEIAHVGIIRLYANTFFGITNTQESIPYGLDGLVTNVPFLYHALLGKLLAAANILDINHYIFLRTINVILTALTVFFGYRLSRMLVFDPWARLLILIMATNTLMATFLGASVSYDNLVDLIAVASLIKLVEFFQSQRPISLLYFLGLVFAGCLTKVSFLPLAGLLVLIYLFERRSALFTDIKLLIHHSYRGTKPAQLSFVLCLLLGLSTALLYGQNFVQFHKLTPSCRDVLSENECMQNRIYARNRIFADYRTGGISYGEAVMAAKNIPVENDRLHTLRLIENERMYKINKPPLMDRLNYIKATWTTAMKPSIFGIMAHRSILKQPDSLIFYDIVFLGAFVAWVRRIQFTQTTRVLNYLGVLSCGYFLFLVGYYNYAGYLGTHAPFVGVQGRYIFPVLVPIYLLAAEALATCLPAKIRIVVFALIAIGFLWGDLPSLLVDPNYRWLMSSQLFP